MAALRSLDDERDDRLESYARDVGIPTFEDVGEPGPPVSEPRAPASVAAASTEQPPSPATPEGLTPGSSPGAGVSDVRALIDERRRALLADEDKPTCTGCGGELGNVTDGCGHCWDRERQRARRPRRDRTVPTPRELAVLERVAEGATNTAIGADLYLSPETIKNHVRHLFVKLGARNRAHLAALAVRRGLVS